MTRTIKIGLSASLLPPQPGGEGLESETRQPLEQSVAQWMMSREVLVFMVPSITQGGMLGRNGLAAAFVTGMRWNCRTSSLKTENRPGFLRPNPGWHCFTA